MSVEDSSDEDSPHTRSSFFVVLSSCKLDKSSKSSRKESIATSYHTHSRVLDDHGLQALGVLDVDGLNVRV